MVRSGWVPVVLLGVGAALVVDSVVRGSASVALVAIIPVVSGSSAEFLVGVVLLLVGFLTLPLLFVPLEGPPFAAPLPDPRARSETPTEEVGGLLLVGPVPVFFGSWKDVSSRVKVATVAVGAALVVAFLLAILLH